MEDHARGSDIIGKVIVDERGKRIGVVDDLALDPKRWAVEGVYVTLDDEAADFLGEKRPLFGHARITIGTPRIATAGDYILLKGTLRDMALALRDAELRERGDDRPSV